MQHRHGTPFEHSFVTFFVHAPILVWREWHRHRIGFSYNEESGRYKVLEPVFYVPRRERLMMKVDGWKPGRPKFLRCEDDAAYGRLCGNLKQAYREAYRFYLDNLSLGIDPGLARDCLPVGIYSSCWVSCNPRSLMAFLSLRTHEPTAARVSYPLDEIELAARKVEEMFAAWCPLTYEAFNKFGRVAP
jgi:thymidylate synthase (FAD)